MTTLRELAYMIEANTDGLNKAFPALDKLTSNLEALEKSITTFGKSVDSGMARAGSSFERQAKGVSRGADAIKSALERQQAATLSAQQKLISLNNTIKGSGADSKLVLANTKAFESLEEAMKRTDITASQVTLAKAKFNATLAESKRQMLDYASASRTAEKAQNSGEAAMLKQENAVERLRIKYLDLNEALQASGQNKLSVELGSSFNDFEAQMKSGVLSSKQFSKSMNDVNAKFASIKRNGSGGGGGFNLIGEIAKSSQVALGPLSGVASRMTALQGLSRNTSIGIAATAGAFIALGAALYKIITDGAAFERQMARINAVLDTTGNKAFISGNQAELIVRKVTRATGAVQSEVRDAAAGLLTLTGMNDKLLESSLLAAQGLALMTGGSITTSFKNLSQVIQSPTEGLQALTRDGVRFSAAEKEQIKLLEMAGNRTEALAIIFKRLHPAMVAAGSGANTLTASWHELGTSLTNSSQDFAVASGLLEGLKNWMDASARTANRASIGYQVFFDTLADSGMWFETTRNNVGSLMKGVVDLDTVFKNSHPDTAALEQYNAALKVITERIKAVEGTNLAPDVNFDDLKKATEAVKGGDIQGAVKALEKYVKVTESSAAAQQTQVNALEAAGSKYTELKQEHSGLITDQEKMDAKLKALSNGWQLMKQNLMDAGASAEKADATLQRLNNDIILQTSSIAGYINQIQKSTKQTEMEGQVAAATGAEKRRLQAEQQVLNDLWSSGIVTSSNYQEALKQLAAMGLSPLVAELEAASKALEMKTFQNTIKQMEKSLQDQAIVAKATAQTATASSYEQAMAIAVVNKQIEMTNAGLTEADASWQRQLNLVKQMVNLDFATKQAASFKELEDSIKISTAAADVAGKSSYEQAMAIAVVTEKQHMLNEGIKEGTALWNARINAAQQLVNLDFTKQSREEVKGLQDQIKAQDSALQAMFYSERTKKRMLSLSEKENELAARYGSLQDERAQKELRLFTMMQERDKLLAQWQDVADVVDNAFKSMEDSIVQVCKTGEINFTNFANSVLEDIFRMTYRQVISDPLKDMVGNLMSSVTGSTSKGNMPSVSEALQIGTMANPAYTYVLNDMGQPGALSDMFMPDGAKSVTDSLFGGKPANDLLRGTVGAGGASTGLLGGGGIGSDAARSVVSPSFGGGGIGSDFARSIDTSGIFGKPTQDLIRKGLDPLTSAATSASSGLSDVGKSLAPLTGGSGGNSPFDSLFATPDKGGFSKVMDLSPKEILDLKKTVQSEVFNFKNDGLFNQQGAGVVDTILNRKASGQWGGSITDVVNAKNQFSAISGNKNAVGNVDNLPMPNSRVDKMVDDYLVQRANGLQSSVGGNLNYLNPAYSSQNSLNKWGNNVVGQAQSTGQVFGAGNAMHYHGTAPGMSPVDSNYGLNLPGNYAGMGGGNPMAFAGSAGGSSPFQQLPQTMQVPGSLGGGGFGGGMGGSSFGGMAGGGGIGSDGGLSGSMGQLSATVNQTNSSMSQLSESLPQVTGNLTNQFDQTAESAQNLADKGLSRASSGMEQLANDTITQSVTSQAQAAASTQQLGTDSIMTSASVQQLGSAALTAAAQMQMGGGGGAGGMLGMVMHGGGTVGGSGGYAMLGGSFANAPRLHGGLHPGEFRAILQRGEGVFTEDQMAALGNAINSKGDPNGKDGEQGGFRSGGRGVQVHLHGIKDYDSFRKSQSQLNAGVSSAMRQADQKQG